MAFSRGAEPDAARHAKSGGVKNAITSGRQGLSAYGAWCSIPSPCPNLRFSRSITDPDASHDSAIGSVADAALKVAAVITIAAITAVVSGSIAIVVGRCQRAKR